MSAPGFVFAVCGGAEHLDRLDRALAFLAAFSRRPATVVTKRMGLTGSGNSAATSNYYATFEFPDRSREEFTLRGPDYGLLAEGDEGTLTTQGTRFHGFQRGAVIQDSAAPGPQPFPRA